MKKSGNEFGSKTRMGESVDGKCVIAFVEEKKDKREATGREE